MVAIQLLAAQHRCEGFDCGDAALNEFLRVHAGQQQRRGFGKTYVVGPAKFVFGSRPTQYISRGCRTTCDKTFYALNPCAATSATWSSYGHLSQQGGL